MYLLSSTSLLTLLLLPSASLLALFFSQPRTRNPSSCLFDSPRAGAFDFTKATLLGFLPLVQAKHNLQLVLCTQLPGPNVHYWTANIVWVLVQL